MGRLHRTVRRARCPFKISSPFFWTLTLENPQIILQSQCRRRTEDVFITRPYPTSRNYFVFVILYARIFFSVPQCFHFVCSRMYVSEFVSFFFFYRVVFITNVEYDLRMYVGGFSKTCDDKKLLCKARRRETDVDQNGR